MVEYHIGHNAVKTLCRECVCGGVPTDISCVVEAKFMAVALRFCKHLCAGVERRDPSESTT